MWRSTVGCIVTFTLSILVAPLVAEAQQTGKAYRIGCLAERRVPPTPDWLEVMRLLGYVEGHNLFFECRNAETREQLPAGAAELVTRQVDLICGLAGDQPQDRAGARSHDPRAAPVPGGRGDQVGWCKASARGRGGASGSNPGSQRRMVGSTLPMACRSAPSRTRHCT